MSHMIASVIPYCRIYLNILIGKNPIKIKISETKTVKGYFIDPVTHAFQHDVSTIMSYSKKEEKLVIKKSVRNHIDYYGEPIKTIINSGNSILPSNFDTKKIKESFTQKGFPVFPSCVDIVKFYIKCCYCSYILFLQIPKGYHKKPRALRNNTASTRENLCIARGIPTG